MIDERVRNALDPEVRRLGFERWKMNLARVRDLARWDLSGMACPVLVIGPEDGRIYEVHDAGARGCGGWTYDPPCGGCDPCMLAYSAHCGWPTMSPEEYLRCEGA